MRKVINTAGDPKCAVAAGGKKIGTELYIVNKNDTVRNVVAYVKEGVPDQEFQPPATKAKLDQVGCRYIPHVQTVMVGQVLTISNGDATMHNIHSVAKKQRVFNIAQTKKGDKRDVTFTRPEFVKVKCDVHGWMSTYIGVFDHPFHAVTDKTGACTIENLPPGQYVIGGWHEQADDATPQNVTVVADKTTEITFNFKLSK